MSVITTSRLPTLMIDKWETPATHYEEEQIDNMRIGRHVYNKRIYHYSGMDGYMYFTVSEPITLTTLKEFRNREWCSWMVDSPPDYRAMQKYAERSRGRVLTTGLGLGLVVHELCHNELVESITVVERSPAVIALVGKYLPHDSRIKVVCDDFWRFVMLDDSKWDTIIVDLWVFTGTMPHLKYYLEEVIPFNKSLTAKYPEANIMFHAFAGMPDKEEVTKFHTSNNLDVMLWGLGERNGEKDSFNTKVLVEAT